MKMQSDEVVSYIIEFLVGKENLKYVTYSDRPEPNFRLTIIKSGLFQDGYYGTEKSVPRDSLPEIPGTGIPFIYGLPKVERLGNGYVIWPDLVASAYFLMSRYEEICKPRCRDRFGRFLAEYSVIFQQGFGTRPLIDEWTEYLKGLLCSLNIPVAESRCGFSKILLTHDLDIPFRYRAGCVAVVMEFVKQVVKKIIKYGDYKTKLSFHRDITEDPYFTYPFMIEQENRVKKNYGNEIAESLYFIITQKRSREYQNINSRKYKYLLDLLLKAGGRLGLHVSQEAGNAPCLIKDEVARLPNGCDRERLASRHHYLQWREPEDIDYIEGAGIREDYTLGYADHIGFRCGTSRPFRFINPRTLRLTGVTAYPLEIMECSLSGDTYMNLGHDEALRECKKVIDAVHEHGGNLNLLFHNSNLTDEFYNKQLYAELCDYIIEKAETSATAR